jgi:hypothetical protein
MSKKSSKSMNEFKKVRSKFNPSDIFYTNPTWETKEVEGVVFIYVIKNFGIRETPKLMRKESLEFVR